MRDARLALIGTSPAALADPFIEAVLSHWPGGWPAVRYLEAQDVLSKPDLLDNAHAVWIVMDRQESFREAVSPYELIALVQDRQIPAMISRPDERVPVACSVQAGVVAAPFDASPQVCCAVLQALASQAQALRDLQTEIRLLRLEQQGLSGQIDRMDEELRLAARLQREFLPARLPQIAGVEFYCLFRPASYVSGDIFDICRLDENHVGLFIADAVGHGVPAALLTVYIKQSLRLKEIGRHFAKNYRLVPPNEVLAKLNHDMGQLQTDSVRTATAWYGLLNIQTRVLQYARAGHPMPLVFRPDGSWRYLESAGALLGVFPEEEFELASVQLEPGERLFLYSDGFETAFPKARAGLQAHGLANDQYVQEFRQLASGPLEQAINRLVNHLDQQAGSLNQVDDLTVVCVSFTSQEASTTQTGTSAQPVHAGAR